MNMHKLISQFIVATLFSVWTLPSVAQIDQTTDPEVNRIVGLIKEIYYDNNPDKSFRDEHMGGFNRAINLSYDEEGNRTISYYKILLITLTKNSIKTELSRTFRGAEIKEKYKNGIFDETRTIGFKPLNLSLAAYKYVNSLNNEYPYKFSLIQEKFKDGDYSSNGNNKKFDRWRVDYMSSYTLMRSSCSTPDCMKDLIKFLVVSKNKYNEIGKKFLPNAEYSYL